MGSTRTSAGAYASYAKSTAHHTAASYTTRSLLPEFDPKLIKVRESVKSAANPHPTPVIVAIDVTGSMGYLAEACRKGLGTLFLETYKRKPVSDPHMMAMALDDMEVVPEALQVTQFEADAVVLGTQIEKLYLVGCGGGNGYESYLGPLYFALTKTKCDAFSEKPARKGFIFTVGDEPPQPVLTGQQIKDFFGDGDSGDIQAAALIKRIEQNWHYYHLIVEEGSHARQYPYQVRDGWAALLGQNVIPLKDHTKMAEVIISLLEVVAGRDKDAVAASWDGSTALTVKHAISGLTVGAAAGTGPVAL